MEITGKILYNKICQIFPEISSSITPEVLNKICTQPANQDFLEWFRAHVTKNNILTDEDIQIKQHLINTGKFLTDDLDVVIEENAKNYPELVQLLESKIGGEIDHNSIFETEKEAFECDLKYLQTLEESVRTLTEQEDKLNDEIEEEQTQLEKETIDVKERYNDCVDLLRDFDEGHKLLHNDVERLINAYADAAEMKGQPVVWTQMPLELCKNQTEMYINYLSAYIRRHFGNNNNKDEHTNDSDYDTFMEDSRDRRGEDMLHELSSCLRNLITSRVEEATAKVSADACPAIEELAANIYNHGNPKVPQTQAQLELEITELSGRRDFLEENVRLLRENRLEEAVTQSAEVAITEILVLDARLRYERRERRLRSMLRLRELAREHGHAHSDLLCMLMELQFRRIIEAFEFVADARYYLSTEYSLSAARDNVMRQLQTEYETIESGSPGEKNVYNKIFISMMNGGNLNDKDALTSSMRELRQIVGDNETTEEKMFGVDIDAVINGVKFLDQKINDVYNREINSDCRTSSLKPISLDVVERTTDGITRVAELQKEVSTRRDRFKDHLRKNGIGFEWEKSILWQRFLTDPESMREAYEDAQKKLEQLHFGKSY